MGALATIVFVATAVLAIGVIIAAVAPQWRRILRVAAGQPDPGAPPSGKPVDRWRAMHAAADARRPFHQVRSDAPRRGLLGRRTR